MHFEKETFLGDQQEIGELINKFRAEIVIPFFFSNQLYFVEYAVNLWGKSNNI